MQNNLVSVILSYQMGKPDIVNEFLGATVGSGVVGPILDKLIEGLKFVCHCREECIALWEELEKVKPLLERISGQHQADSAMKNWLSAFEDCVEKADEVQKNCKSDSSSIWERGYEVKYGREILELNNKISENIKLAPMAHLVLQSESKSTGACGITQHVPDKILGMDHHFKRMRSAVMEGHRRKDSSCCVGVRGMGGAGKTLLAQMVNNDEEIQQEFGKESIIWITVGRDAEISVIYERMRKCLGVRNDGGSLEDQRTQLVNEFLKQSVLLILDDIWDGIVHEFKEMVYWLNITGGAGSVTVVTTRDEAITRKCVNVGEEIILRLSEEQSWELFRTHAFGTETVPLNRDLEVLARHVCEECKCLPLALKVIGRAMKGKRDIREWRKTLRNLQGSSMFNKGVEKELFERLHISYDQLDEPIKKCFLYFAAFPEDCKIPVQHLCQVWVVEGLFGEELEKEEALDEAHCALNELLGRSLIERGYDDKRSGKGEWVQMHDVLHDLAIHISGEGNESERENLFNMKKDLGQFPNSWLVSSLKVKRLSLWGNKIKRFPANFIAPTLQICMLYPVPWYCLKKDSVRAFENSTIEEGFFTNMQELKYLQMCANKELQHLPESIGGLGSLQHLDISWCEALQQLPESIRGLRSLQHLDVGGCVVLQQLPESIGGLGSLQWLDISRCWALLQLPESIGGLGSLQRLDISRCWSLQQLPESIGGLGSLQRLDISRCWALLQLPENIGGLGSLQYLNISWCTELQQLPESIRGLGSLQHLDVSGCAALEQLPESIGGLGSLQHLNISWCQTLQQLPESIGGLGSLQHLDVSGCHSLHQLPESIGGLGSLQHLDMKRCFALQQLPESIGGLGSLQYLNISFCNTLQQLPKSIGGLRSLQHLSLRKCKALQQLPKSIEGLVSLQYLNLSDCEALKQLLDFPNSSCLQIIF
jgi:Leucine-rich repeat (LRR) protein